MGIIPIPTNETNEHTVYLLMLESSFQKVEFYLFKSATLFLLFFDAFLSVMQQLPLVLLGVPALSCQLGLLPLVSL